MMRTLLIEGREQVLDATVGATTEDEEREVGVVAEQVSRFGNNQCRMTRFDIG